MKIVINYDIMDKIAEAKNGYSLKRCAKRTLGFTSVSTIISAPDNFVNGKIYPELLVEIGIFMAIHSMYTDAYVVALNGFTQANAKYKLAELVEQLRRSCIKTDAEAILDTYKYKSQYDVHFKSIIPTIEQKKYLMIPVKDEYFGNKEIPIVQEHIIGARDYVLSLGEPEQQKTYSLKPQITNGR